MSTKLNQDQTQAEQVFSGGICRDVARHLIPAGSVYDSVDFMLERPGVAYKRGGWERHSAVLGAATSVAAVATIHIPTRVVAVSGAGTLYDVTSENSPQADSIGACFGPAENPPLYLDRLIFCDSTAAAAPKKVYWTSGGGGTIAVANLGGSPPAARHSTVYASRIVLGRGDGTSSSKPYNRIWFSPLPDVESTWDTANFYLDVTNEITGLAAVQGVLLVFSPTGIERIIGGVPPGEEGENMQLQPVAGVGCLDARSIVHIDGEVLFAGEQGVFATNGGAPRSLTEKADGSGIQSYWRTLFPPNQIRQVAAGLLARDFYIVSILTSTNTVVDTLICHLPSERWTRASNMGARMFAGGRTEDETSELYMAAAAEGYVERISSILRPLGTNRSDGDGTAVTPTLYTRPFGGGTPGLKAYGLGHLTYQLQLGLKTSTNLWAALTVKTVGAQIVANNVIFEVTARTGDFKTGTVEPVWTTVDGVGNTIVDSHVTWTNRGPVIKIYPLAGTDAKDSLIAVAQLKTSQPLGGLPGSTADGKYARKRFTVGRDDVAMTVWIDGVGSCAQLEIATVEMELRPYDGDSEGS